MGDKFALLRKILKALGLSDERAEEIVGRIQEWLLDDKATQAGQTQFPYRLRDDFLSPAELTFYRVLQSAASGWATIICKVSLGDLFYTNTGDHSQNQAYRNKIDRKHVDFVLCEPQTMRPLIGIELDDKSHQRPDRQVRDIFVEGVFTAANLPLLRVPVRQTYPLEPLKQLLQQKAGIATPPAETPNIESKSAVPTCPKCGSAMALRTAKSGPNQGGQFWGCSKFPQCRGMLPYQPA
jgi:hypothetical protein